VSASRHTGCKLAESDAEGRSASNIYRLAAAKRERDEGAGYLGLGMITPVRKPPHRELLDWEKEFNTAINKSAGESNKRSRT
jgi:hypothetical protein